MMAIPSQGSRKIGYELLTWGEIERLARHLAQLIRNSGYLPEVVIAIARGGYVPARLICDLLDIYELSSLRVSHYTSGAHKEQSAQLTAPLNIDITGQRVLLIDDISDSGDTLRVTLEHLRSFNPADIRIGVLHHKTVSAIEPDYYARKIVKWRWVIYPWAVVENLSDLISAMKPLPQSEREANERLRLEHGINVKWAHVEESYLLMKSKIG